MMKRWICIENGKSKGAPLVQDLEPVVEPDCGLVFVELADGVEPPVDGSTLDLCEWIPPVPPAPVPMDQPRWDSIRRARIEKIEREAQTKMLEMLVLKAGMQLPAKAMVIRAIRAADTVGSSLPGDDDAV